MFCSKCGNQLNDGAAFCPKCGNQMGAAPKAATTTTPNLASNAIVGRILGCDKLVLGVFGATVLSFIFAMVKNFVAKASYDGVTQSQSVSMFTDLAGWRVVSIILFIASIALLALPLFTSNKWKFVHILTPAVSAGFNFLYTVIFWIDKASEMSEISAMAKQFGGKASFGPNFWGWMLIIFSAAIIAACVKLLLDQKKNGGFDFSIM